MPLILKVLLAVQVISALAIIILVLLQQGKGADMGPRLAAARPAACSAPPARPTSCRA